MHVRIETVNGVYAQRHLSRNRTNGEYTAMGKNRHFIREWRKFRGLSQVKLSEKAEVTQSMISRVESGQPYDQEFLERVALALGCTPPDLIVRDPTDPEGLWSIADQLSPVQRSQLVEFAKVIKKTGT